MAVLRSIRFNVSRYSEYSLHFTVPPVFEVDTYYDQLYHGYITGVTGTEFLPQTMITTPKAFGGTHFHGFNVIDREVTVTFQPLSSLKPSELRDKVNRASSASKGPGNSGEIEFEVSSLYDRSGSTTWVRNRAEISGFEFDSFKESTEGKITFKMPDPYFLTVRKSTGSSGPVVFSRHGNNGFLMSKNPKYTNKEDFGLRGELLYDITLKLDAIKKGDGVRFYGARGHDRELEEPFTIQFLTSRPAGEYIRIYKEDVLGYNIETSLRSSYYLTLGRPPRVYQDEKRVYGSFSSDVLISDAKLNSHAIALEGF